MKGSWKMENGMYKEYSEFKEDAPRTVTGTQEDLIALYNESEQYRKT